MANIDLSISDHVFVLRMKSGENRFNPDFLKAMNDALDEVEAHEGPCALVTTGEGKFYSNGLDLEYMSTISQEDVMGLIRDVHALFARFLSFPGHTVAAMNGHSFAGGGMLALSHDSRVMRSDRGYFCLPEIDLGMPFSRGMASLIKERLSPAAVRATVLSGARLSASDALAQGVVDATADEEVVLTEAINRARLLAQKNGKTMRLIKEGFYREALEDLRGARGLELPS